MTEPPSELKRLLEDVAAGRVEASEALASLAALTFVDVGSAKLDVAREHRTGEAEAVYAPGKTPHEIETIVRTLSARASGPLFVTRATAEQYEAARRAAPAAIHHPRSGLVVVRADQGAPAGRIAVVTAGTSDEKVAEEALRTAEALGLKVERVRDVGIAAPQRLLAHREALAGTDCVVVVAGMEGALPSMVAAVVDRPVVAVPTSVGYGASFGGLAALLGMLSSCAPGVSVVNVDNGFGAAVVAHRIVRSSPSDPASLRSLRSEGPGTPR